MGMAEIPCGNRAASRRESALSTTDRNYLNGKVAALGYWLRALNPDEFVRLHAQTYGGFEAGMPFASGACTRPLIDGSLASNTSLLGAIA